MTPKTWIPVANIVLHERLGNSITIIGDPTRELGQPLVEIKGTIDHNLRHLTPDKAEEIAAALILAARIARGEPVPTALDRFLEKKVP